MKKRVSHFIAKTVAVVTIITNLSACAGTTNTAPSPTTTVPNPSTATEVPIITKTPLATEAPKITETPTVTDAPVITETPTVTNAPVITQTPTVTDAPVITQTPTVTDAPVITQTPTVTEAPAVTENPTPTATPMPTVAPRPTTVPVNNDPNVRNLNGMELVIGIPSYSKEPDTPEYHALQARRKELMQKHNFTVRVEYLYNYGTGNPIQVFQTAATLGDPTFQVYYINSRSLNNNTHLFYDLSTLSEFDFSDEKWNNAVTKAMSYKGGIYGMSPLTTDTPQIKGVVYNKRLFKEAGLDPDLPYKLQKSGEWTWDTFKELCAQLTRDTDNDGNTDVYATCSYGSEMLDQLLSSTGSQIVTTENGRFANNAESDNILRASTFAVELARSGYEKPPTSNDNWDYYMTAFSSGQAAMQFTQSGVFYDTYNSYTGMKDELGFVCCPKMDSSVDYQMNTESYVAVIPAFYDAETASDIAFAFQLWSNPVSEEGSYDWRTLYNNIVLDEKILTDTFPYYYEKNLGTIPAHYLVSSDVDFVFYYSFPFADAPVSQYLKDLSALLSADVTKANSAKKPKVTVNANVPNINYATRINYDGTVAITRFRSMVPRNLVLPDKINGMIVSEIAGDVFSNCGLTSVVLPKDLKKIGSWAFAFGDFTDFVLPEGMTTICSHAITGANLQTVTVPASVIEIEKDAFSSNVDLTLIVEKGSYAETYAKENGLKVQYK